MPSAKKPSQSNTESKEPLHSAASKDIWLAGLGAMAQAQAQARAQGSKAFEALVAEGLAFQRKSQEAAQEKMREAARLQEQGSAEIRNVVGRMRDEGLTMRDIAVLLGVTPQRVAQLAPCVEAS